MGAEFIGSTLDVIGKIMVAYTAIAVHRRVWKERRIDGKVFREMRREQIIGALGIILIMVGYLLQLPAKLQQ